MPRVSRPAEPASERKHGVSAVKRSGSLSCAVISSRTRLVSGTSAVGMSQRHVGGLLRTIRRCRLAANVEVLVSNFGSWPVPYMHLVAHHQRRLHFGVAMLGRVQVEHELPERALQPRQLPVQHGEAAARQLGGALEIHHAERFADLEMLPRPVGARRHAADLAQLDIVVLVLADGHVVERQVGDDGERIVQLPCRGAAPRLRRPTGRP